MLNASLAWLGDGTRLAVFEACCAVAVSATSPHHSSNRSTDDHVHLVVVSVSRRGSLGARQVAVPAATPMPDTIGTDATRPNSLLVSRLISGDRAATDRLTIGSSRSTLSRALTIAHAQVVAFDPSGQQLLYLVGHSPPNLLTATLGDRQLTERHLLIRSPPLAAYAW